MSAEFWNMSGYAVFVWGSFAAALVVHLWNLWGLRAQRRAALEESVEE
ncbi:MAG TPA: heme exporter protein CcmD [Solimonas sp.]